MTNPRTSPDTQLRGPARIFVQAAWLIVVGVALMVFAAGIPARFGQLMSVVAGDTPGGIEQRLGLSAELLALMSSRLGQAEADALHYLGLSLGFYAGYILTFEVALAVVSVVTGIFIFWRRPDDWMTLWISLFVVILGTNGLGLVVLSLATVWPSGMVLAFLTMVGLLGMVSLPHILFLSPDGQFVPRWTRRIAAGCTGGILALGVSSLLANQGVWSVSSLVFVFVLWIGVLALGVFNQVYRYMKVSGPVQRQQTKWMIIGLGAVALGFVLNAAFLGAPGQQPGLPRLLFYLVRVPLVNLCMLLLPVCLAFSIFRYRLWDIDVIIRRTLVYSILSGLLVLTYFVLIVVLQRLFTFLTGQGQNQLVSVLSTLAIALLVLPLRRRVQDFIDRRFFRKKYDAQKVLAEFASTARDETDVEKLTVRLMEVVEETMQPEHVSVWLRPSAERLPRSAVGRQRQP